MYQGLIKITVAFVLAILLVACVQEREEKQAIQAGNITISDMQPAAGGESATFQDLGGRPLEISSFAGRKLILNYWATWCAPCIEEIPALSRAAEILGPEGYIFVLASDEPLETITAFIAENEFSGNFIKLNSFFSTHGIQAVPSTVLYDESGQELNSWLGAYEWDSPELLTELRSF
jgi:thiol-disulfide isomerase/thioredoxin